MISGRARLIALGLTAMAALAACSSAGQAPTQRSASVALPPAPAHSVVTAAGATPVGPAAPMTSATPANPPATPPPPNPCAANAAAQLVRVSVRQQHLWMCAGRTLVRDTAVTTGIPGEDTHTPTGTFTIQGRTRNTTLTLLSGKTYAVKYWIPFQGPLFGFHDSSWQTFAYGSAQYRTDGSHGCVHMPVQAIAFLYRWVHVGAKVRIA